MNKYYAAGVEISTAQHERILAGKTSKLIRCPDNQPGISLGFISEHINVIDGKLDELDPTLNTVLNYINLPLEKTYIIQIFNPPIDNITAMKNGAVYGYW